MDSILDIVPNFIYLFELPLVLAIEKVFGIDVAEPLPLRLRLAILVKFLEASITVVPFISRLFFTFTFPAAVIVK